MLLFSRKSKSALFFTAQLHFLTFYAFAIRLRKISYVSYMSFRSTLHQYRRIFWGRRYEITHITLLLFDGTSYLSTKFVKCVPICCRHLKRQILTFTFLTVDVYQMKYVQKAQIMNAACWASLKLSIESRIAVALRSFFDMFSVQFSYSFNLSQNLDTF